MARLAPTVLLWTATAVVWSRTEAIFVKKAQHSHQDIASTLTYDHMKTREHQRWDVLPSRPVENDQQQTRESNSLFIPIMRVDAGEGAIAWLLKRPLPLRLHDYAMQARIFAWVVLILACTAPFLALQFCVKDRLQAYCLVLGILSCIYFGIDNFMISYAASYLKEPSAHMALLFFFEGGIACVMHVVLMLCSSTYKSAWRATLSSSRRELAYVVLTGVSIALAQICGNIGFSIDQADAGPHQALVCLDVLIVSPFFYWHSGEVFTKMQMAGCALMIAGALVLSDIMHWSGQDFSLRAFTWLFLSMLFYAGSIITWRLACIGRDAMPWQPRLMLIFGTVGIMGFLPFCVDWQTGVKEFVATPVLLVWPLLNAVVSILGMWSVNLAFDVPGVPTGVITSIVDSNSVALLLMNMTTLHLMPSLGKLVGMSVILLGGICTCFADVAVK